MPTTSKETNDELHQELRQAWVELKQVQADHKHINVSLAADWLRWAEEALNNDHPSFGNAKYCIVRANFSMVKAEECVGWVRWGYLAVFLEFLYLLGLPLCIFLYSYLFGETLNQIMTAVMLQVPFYVFVWGFLGGVSWCFYHAAYWTKRRLFDKNYLPWYITHPWISAVLGGATSLILLGGLAGLGTPNPNNPPSSSLISLVSFMAGFSTNALWKLLDNTVRKTLGVKESQRSLYEEAVDERFMPEA